mgnify:CR=1 FL=1
MDTTYSLADIAAATGGNRNNDGFGDGNGWWIILFLFVVVEDMASAAGAEMVEAQTLRHSRDMRPALTSTQHCPHRESKTVSRTFPVSFATALLV